MSAPPPAATRHLVDGLVALAFVAAVWSLPDRFYAGLLTEDGPVEWLQVVALGVVAGVCAGAARRTPTRPATLALAGAALLMVVAIGEELAWGTRLFDITVASLQAHNVQGEATLHNLAGVRGLSKTFAALAGIGALGALAVVRRRPGLALWFALPAIYSAVRVLYPHPITYRFAKLSEVLELVLYVALARVALRPGLSFWARSTTFAVVRRSQNERGRLLGALSDR